MLKHHNTTVVKFKFLYLLNLLFLLNIYTFKLNSYFKNVIYICKFITIFIYFFGLSFITLFYIFLKNRIHKYSIIIRVNLFFYSHFRLILCIIINKLYFRKSLRNYYNKYCSLNLQYNIL